MKYLNLLAFVAVLVMNYLANALPINGKTTGELSAQYPNLFVPAGITFSIWGIIYLLLLVFIVMQMLETHRTIVGLLGVAFVLSCLANAGWIVAWHYEKLPLSMVLMLGLLASLIYINLKLADQPSVFLKLVFGIYLGWICIATIANATAWLVALEWNAWGVDPRYWTVVLIAIGAAITIIAMYRLQNPFLALAVIWAFAGIILKQYGAHPIIVYAASIGIVVVFFAFFSTWRSMLLT
ncbi:MAG: hypothetical protein ACK4VN_10870 [Bacteroidales bacterium]